MPTRRKLTILALTRFEYFDKDGDGVLNDSEKATAKRAHNVIDYNDDGKVHNAADKNDDGKIGPREYKHAKHHKKHHDKHH